MWIFIVSGAIYLIGVAVVLVIKPSFMFAPDGNWKEFGIGQNEARYTSFPFWLFCLVWAVISYVFVLLTLPLVLDISENRAESNIRVKRNTRTKRIVEDSDLMFDDEMESSTDGAVPQGLPKGVYVLNKKASKMAGVPKYVYIGEDAE
jgi:hypothetical protein